MYGVLNITVNTNRAGLFFFSDVDECISGVHKCDQQSTACNNTRGNYICQCKNGYQPAQSLYKCQGNTVNNLFDYGSYAFLG